jgi:hypothetical protein
MNSTHSVAGAFTAYAHEKITVPDSIKSLTSANLEPTTVAGRELGKVRFTFITVEDQPMRYTFDGTTVSTSVGHLVDDGDTITLAGLQSAKLFRAIRTGGSSAVLRVTYMR